MEKALVLGASGGMGYSIVKELTNRRVNVIAFARNKEKLTRLFSDNEFVSIVSGDIFQYDDLLNAASGVDVIFHAANIPYYEWEHKLPKLIENILNVAKVRAAKLAVVDNIYAYGRSNQKLVTESSPKVPHTKKGKIRLNIESQIRQSDVPALIAHFPDFYGPNASNTLLHFTLENVIKNKKAYFVGNKKINREFIYTPDGAKALVNLAFCNDAYGQNWNIPGCGVITGEQIFSELNKINGYQKLSFTVTKTMIRLLGLVNPMMREVVEMFYLNEDPVLLSGKKYEQFLGEVPSTSYSKGLKETLEYMKGSA
ncbi:NAD(P)H-binding protein [Aquibacillus kalidii]|uniref:NAD(P)H-binding protein n=1 Tax=Aquibacillus kalidii TaxID=2762597 RepID=UPI0016474704|nr:NAD(P)H-binding protein [Aquibacillus kalidii]